MIKQHSIDEVYANVRIEEIISDYVALKKRGVNLLGLCPFHQEKSPSFTVSPAKNIFKCFGCDRGGNVVTFLQEIEGYSYPEAIRHIAGKLGIRIEETEASPEYLQEKQQKESLSIINEFARTFYKQQLYNTDRGRNVGLAYFRHRGLRESTLNTYELGYAPLSRTALTQTALDKGFKLEYLQQAGLTTETGKDFFFDRVMFPIHNTSGKVIGFAGRSMKEDKKSPKYINSKESELYNKREVLYGLHQARQPIRKDDRCYLVEGYTDVLSLHQNGIKNVVAASGTALTTGQLRRVQRYSNNLSIIFDGDQAGLKAAMRGIDIALEQGLDIQLIILPSDEDPDSLISREGVAKFRQYLDDNSQDFILFKTGLALKEAESDPVKKAALVQDIIRSIALIQDAIKRSIYTRQCSAMLQIDEHLLVAEINKEINKRLKDKRLDQIRRARQDHSQQNRLFENKLRQERQGKDQHKGEGSKSGDEAQERHIIKLLLLYGARPMAENAEEIQEQPTVAQYILANLKEIIDEFDQKLYANIVKAYAKMVQRGTPVDPGYFTNHRNEDFQKTAVDVCTEKYELSENWEKRWDIRLQTQPMPENNHFQDVLQGVLKLKLKKIESRLESNIPIIKKHFEEGNKPEEEKYIKLHSRLNDMKKVISDRLNTVVLP